MVSRLEYLEHFLDSVDFVSSGKKGGISNDRWLTVNYENNFFTVVEKHLKSPDDRVRAETIMLLTSVKERSAMDAIKEMRIRDNERVSTACLGYMKTIGEDDNLIPELIETLDYKRGQEFRNAAAKIGTVGRSSDIPTIRRIYGQVNGDMRSQIKDAMVKIIDKYPELKSRKELLLSVPVFPDEKGFEKFLRTSENYLDVRYRNTIHPRSNISMDTYNNIVRGIKNIRTRLFNESDNLVNYSVEYTDRYNALVDVLAWAVEDISKKEITNDDELRDNATCTKCGSTMIFGSGEWRCLECGNKR